MIRELLSKPGAAKHFANLDFSNNKELHDILLLAAQICEAPMALITFLIDDQQLIKVNLGTDLDKTNKEDSFCQHITDRNALLVVANATEDPRFADNPYVKGAPHIRTYAGAPLCTDGGEILGSLCILNHQPQELTTHQREVLTILSRQAYRLMELELNNQLLKKHSLELEEQKKEALNSSFKLRAIFESSPDCFMLLDHQLKVIAFNKSLSRFIKNRRNKDVKTGIRVNKIISPKMVAVYTKYCQIALQQGKSSVKEYKITYDDDRHLWWRISFNPALDAEGEIIGVTVNAKDISERKDYEEKVLQQNESLRKIAFIQSHELRRPLANILGLVSLMKEQEPYNEIHQKLEDSAMELDERLCYAAKYSEEYGALDALYPPKQDL